MRATLLTRVALLEAASPEQAWQHTEGLCALLAYARAHPAEPWEEEDAAEDLSGLALLLREARAWHAAQKGLP
jgi:hypothetical protein